MTTPSYTRNATMLTDVTSFCSEAEERCTAVRVFADAGAKQAGAGVSTSSLSLPRGSPHAF